MPRTLFRNDEARRILNAKVSERVHTHLIAAALENRRSLAREVEHRLELALTIEATRAAIRDEVRKCLKGQPAPKEARARMIPEETRAA